ncbi:arp2/3 complex-activating protein rickA-like isoform X1 [Epinephelus fuscoguttatus]|uniref:arp2/3 complex-activating protein rickA-like isoform X1 n=1 Tax=Epinephelus fuscoguttatus TaxID=293821 RepID=UPI0020D12575|nr:arp2/3 complex-activating protein rickA-like isoform X1 [Epinephelus fuscoguttatus]
MHSEDSGSHFPTHPPNTFYRATSLHLLEAMAQFIHLLLLLGMCHVAATAHNERQVWLLEGSSATFPFPKDRTIKYCGRGGCKCECDSNKCKSNNASLPGVTVTDSNLTITNFTREKDEINLCYDSPTNHQCVHLNVSIGCSESHHITFAKGDTKHKVTTVADCRRLCTEDPTCQYFTFYTHNTTCFLMTSRDDMLIQLHSYAVSGNNCAPVNPTPVPPGPTTPQPSDEEEEAPVNPTSVPPGPTPPQPSDEEEEAPVNPTSVPPGPTPPQPSVEEDKEEAPVNPTSVPPGPTPPQPSVEEEEEEAPVNPTSAPPGPTPPQPSDEEDKEEAPVNPTSVPPGPTPPQPSDEEEEAPVNPTSVPPGPTPPQPSDEEDKEEGPKCQQMVFWS